jgi:catechol 2,3-dioxygenase-like lactoylglutathione lyase family enzyme
MLRCTNKTPGAVGEGNSAPESLGSQAMESTKGRGRPRYALGRGEKTMERTLSLESIGQVSRTVGDIAQAESWYGKVLGLKHLYTFGKLAFFDCGGTRLYLTAEQPAGPESILYLRVGDIRAAHDELRARGVEFTGVPHLVHRHADGTEEWMAFFKDPDGRPLALMSQVRP